MSTPRYESVQEDRSTASALRLTLAWLESGISPLNDAVSLMPREQGFQAGQINYLRRSVEWFTEETRMHLHMVEGALAAKLSERTADAYLRALRMIEEHEGAARPGSKIHSYYGEVPTWDDLPELDPADRIGRYYVTTDRAQIARGTRDGWERTETP